MARADSKKKAIILNGNLKSFFKTENKPDQPN